MVSQASDQPLLPRARRYHSGVPGTHIPRNRRTTERAGNHRQNDQWDRPPTSERGLARQPGQRGADGAVEGFYAEYYFRPRGAWRIVRKAILNEPERRRLYKEAREYLAGIAPATEPVHQRAASVTGIDSITRESWEYSIGEVGLVAIDEGRS